MPRIVALAFVLAFPSLVAPAWAQPFNTTFVSGAGSDMNTCGTPVVPCRQIDAAIIKTNPGGVIHVLTGRYNAFTVTKSLEIIADGGQAQIDGGNGSSCGLSAITVFAAATDLVAIRGFHVHQKSSGGVDAVCIGEVGGMNLENCTLAGSPDSYGVVFRPGGASELYVSNCRISGNGVSTGGGILIQPTGSGSAKVVLDNTRIENNLAGILIDGRTTTGSNMVIIRNSTVAGSGAFGIYAADSGGGATNVTVEGSTSANNATFGIGSNGVNSFVRVRNSTVTGNGTGLQIASNGKIISLGGNSVRGNTANGAFTATEAQQ